MAGRTPGRYPNWARGAAPSATTLQPRTHRRFSCGSSARVLLAAGVLVPLSSRRRSIRKALSRRCRVCTCCCFLSLAARRRLALDEYIDDSAGVRAERRRQDRHGARHACRPRLTFSGERLPSRAYILQLHQTPRAR